MPKPEEVYSYADYLTWPEEERWEILDGIAYMKATPLRKHQEILRELLIQFANYLQDKPCRVYPAPFCVRLDNAKNNKNVKNVVEPDITIVCDKSKLDENGCKGVPDMIIEILSPSTAKNDKFVKFNKYEKAGVREYWIVEPESRLLSIFTLQKNKRYGRPDLYTEKDKARVFIFPELEINLEPVFSFVEQ